MAVKPDTLSSPASSSSPSNSNGSQGRNESDGSHSPTSSSSSSSSVNLIKKKEQSSPTLPSISSSSLSPSLKHDNKDVDRSPLPPLRSFSVRSSPSRKMVHQDQHASQEDLFVLSRNRNQQRLLSHHMSLEEHDANDRKTSPSSPFISEDYDTFVKCKSEEYSRQIQKLQEDYLYPLKEDLSEWINRILGVSEDKKPVDEESNKFFLTPDNFIDRLDNGVIICKVAKLIESQCDLTDIVLDRIKKDLMRQQQQHSLSSSSSSSSKGGQSGIKVNHNNSITLKNRCNNLFMNNNNKDCNISHNNNNNNNNGSHVIHDSQREDGKNDHQNSNKSNHSLLIHTSVSVKSNHTHFGLISIFTPEQLVLSLPLCCLPRSFFRPPSSILDLCHPDSMHSLSRSLSLSLSFILERKKKTPTANEGGIEWKRVIEGRDG